MSHHTQRMHVTSHSEWHFQQPPRRLPPCRPACWPKWPPHRHCWRNTPAQPPAAAGDTAARCYCHLPPLHHQQPGCARCLPCCALPYPALRHDISTSNISATASWHDAAECMACPFSCYCSKRCIPQELLHFPSCGVQQQRAALLRHKLQAGGKVQYNTKQCGNNISSVMTVRVESDAVTTKVCRTA